MYLLYDTYSAPCLLSYIQTYSDIFRHIHVLFRHIQSSCGIFRILCDSCIFRTLPYLEFWHIKNPKSIQNSVKAFSDIFRTLCNARIWERCHIQNFVIFKTWDISELIPNLFEHIHMEAILHINSPNQVFSY